MQQRSMGFFQFISKIGLWNIINLSMNKIQKTLILSLIMIALAMASQNVNFICETVDLLTCRSGYRYRTVGTYQNIPLNSTYCLPLNQTCETQSNSFNIQSCKIDYKNTECPTGVCFMYPAKPICVKDAKCGTANEPLPYTSNYTCTNCNDKSNCSKCFFQTTNRINSTTRTISTCLGTNCTQGISTTRATVSRCPNGVDGLGQPCDCCVTTQQVARFCSTNSPALAQAQITTWLNKVDNPAPLFNPALIFTSLLALILSIVY